MAPIPRADLDMDNQSTDVADSQDMDSPARRQFSEPLRPHSTSTQLSPSPEPFSRWLKCDWCGKLLELVKGQFRSEEEVLNAHVAADHPDHHPNDDEDEGAEDEMLDETQMNEEDLELDPEEAEDEADEEADDAEVDVAEDLEGHEADTEMEELENEVVDDENDDHQVDAVSDRELAAEGPQRMAASVVNVGQTEHEDENGPSPVDSASAAQAGTHAQVPYEYTDWLSNPRTKYTADYLRRTAEWQEGDIKARLPKIWNVNNVKQFCPSYREEMAKVDSNWQDAFREKQKRPEPYAKTRVEVGEFLELSDPDELLKLLGNAKDLTPEELYAVTQAAASFVKIYQDEYLALDKLYNQAHRHMQKDGTPLARVPEHDRDYEDKKEARLYGYKHTYHKENKPTSTAWTPQDPFTQGSFVATPALGRKMTAKIQPGDRNPDGWKPVVRHGVEFVPRLYEERLEPTHRGTRKRKATEIESLGNPPIKSDKADDTHEDETESDEEDPARTRRTRGGVRNTRPARGVVASGESLPPPAAGATRGSTRGGRGRRGAFNAPAAASATPQPAASVVEESTVSAQEDSPMRDAAPPPRPVLPTRMKDATTQEEMDEIRRQKIMNSKNPKRTKAMLDHWERFNREGRIRNPKRSKAQIESDRTADEDKRASEAARAGGRRRRSTSISAMSAGNLAPKTLNPVAPMPGPSHLAPTLPHWGWVIRTLPTRNTNMCHRQWHHSLLSSHTTHMGWAWCQAHPSLSLLCILGAQTMRRLWALLPISPSLTTRATIITAPNGDGECRVKELAGWLNVYNLCISS
ncbi:hypothetical protein N7468_001076 [Penicillium chermesinum]|uniref:Uncharacterized protein n=1 Tax=Penicillium chermesinum TaxID=63820 RepID=A0A9W9PFX5_9EURO|nr:uncharacterized protein N7468_001076 [Penicillium chermesinum]KAJ5246093.1 hypothetical protein N7468_001076 [Penicillium chermesinum]